ncbi:hypothetical protein FIBSPDRAFT_43213 [Athelia psychrophila]|uniref:DRBM domain-containing protein n=1 Tax=Athelia psychrophila TaxID=1759441 RepID=A0A166TZQ5_9AGAM|nr:hypothetical protein FIBSPDRAFT_43213 [Fibularhizoctonia sp. CBS 109695]
MSLKRPASSTSDATGHSTAAELPPLHNNIILQVFTHKSLQLHAESVNNARLAELGNQTLRMAITHTLFHHKEPVLDVERMIAHREDLLGDDSIEHWVNIYGLRRKVRCLPDAFASLNKPEERRLLFNTYVGAVCVQDGIQAVQTWIDQLIRPNENRCGREQTLEAGGEGSQLREVSAPPTKRIKIEPGYINTSQGQILAPVLPPRFSSSVPRFSNMASTPSTPTSTATQLPPGHEPRGTNFPPPLLAHCTQLHNQRALVPSGEVVTAGIARASSAQVGVPPLPLPARPSPQRDTPPHIPEPVPIPNITNPLAPAQSRAAFLPLFNQMASQRRVVVKYTFDSIGPPHACRWRVTCLANDILKGIGDGQTKQIAKEQAARQAYFAMGWAPNLP